MERLPSATALAMLSMKAANATRYATLANVTPDQMWIDGAKRELADIRRYLDFADADIAEIESRLTTKTTEAA